MRSVCFTIGLAAVVAAAGCGSGDGRATVKGKVTVAGKPLPGGLIQLVDVGNPNRNASGQIAADGSYEVFDAPVGECKVAIDNSFLDPKGNKSGGMAMLPPGMRKGGGGPPPDAKAKMAASPKGLEIPDAMNAERDDLSNRKYVKIDGIFSKPESTPLTYTVESGTNTKDFEVK